MSEISGSQLVARQLKAEGAEAFFYIMGGPMIEVMGASMALGIRGIDVRHEQAAAMAAHAWARLKRKPGICMAASGPAMANLVTGVATAYADSAPIIALGGASSISEFELGAFQEIDQTALMQPITKWARRVHHTQRIPYYVNMAFRQARFGTPGPVYLDLPGDVLYRKVDQDKVMMPPRVGDPPRPAGEAGLISDAVALLKQAERPILVGGTGLIWSDAADEVKEFAELVGIPVFTTPQGRGVLAEDHILCPLAARSVAFREADLVFMIGTRCNFIVQYGAAPRFAKEAKTIRVDIDPLEIEHNRTPDVGIVGDAKAVLRQLIDEGQGQFKTPGPSAWVKHLNEQHEERWAKGEAIGAGDDGPIHPLRLCREVRDFLDRDAVVVVDGHEILNFGRQSVMTYMPGHRMNAGPFGCMGIGVPFGLGAKVAKPDNQVLVLSGDGSFGLNAMEFDTAVRHNIPMVVVISNNGGWTGAIKGMKIPGRDLGFTHYERLVQELGGHGEYVEQPKDIRPALDRAFSSGKPACINVKVDEYARARTLDFGGYSSQLA